MKGEISFFFFLLTPLKKKKKRVIYKDHCQSPAVCMCGPGPWRHGLKGAEEEPVSIHYESGSSLCEEVMS